MVAAESAGLVVRVIGLTGRHSRGFIPPVTPAPSAEPICASISRRVCASKPRSSRSIRARGEAKLSLRALREDSEKAAYHEYRASVAKASKFGTLGDLIANATKKR